VFKIGFGEILLLFLLAVVFIKPEQLPGLFRKAGRLFARLRQLKREMDETVSRFEEEVRRSEDSSRRREEEQRQREEQSSRNQKGGGTAGEQTGGGLFPPDK
jgi:Sec-independent protein translocase protein TatA